MVDKLGFISNSKLFVGVMSFLSQADILKEKGVIITEVKEDGKDFRKQWEYKFASHLSEAEKNEIYLKQFLWHVFSYKTKYCFKKNDAVKAFNLVLKNECYIFYQDSETVLMLKNADNMSADDIINIINQRVVDVYVVDKDYSWTYVVTHENNCGPYFYSKVVRGLLEHSEDIISLRIASTPSSTQS